MKQQEIEKKLDTIPVPKERLAVTRMQAVRRIGQQQHRRKEWTYRFVLAATVLLLLVGVTRFSVKDETGGQGTSFIRDGFERGEDDILKNDAMQIIGTSVTQDGVTMTIDTVLADAYGMEIFYTIEAPYDLSNYHISDATIAQASKKLPAASTYRWDDQQIKRTGQIDFFVSEESLSKSPDFELDFVIKGEKELKFHIPFTLTKDFHQQQLYALNQTIIVEKQKFTVHEVILTPVRTMVRISSDAENDQQILSFGKIRLVDERNQEITSVLNGMTASGSMSEGYITYLLESVYLQPIKRLMLEIENMNAIPKAENYIEVNFAKREAKFVPTWLTVDLTISENSVTLVGEGHSQLSYAIDAQGKHFEMESHSSSGNESTTTYPVSEMENPVKIYFYDYPRTIEFERNISVFQ